MALHDLSAQSRDLNVKPNRIREQGFIPSTIYGPNISPQSIQVAKKDITSFLKKGNRNQVLNLAIGEGEQPIQALFHQYQRHPLTDELLTIEFYAVDPDKEVTVEIPVHLTGEAPTVKIYKGILFHTMEKLRVRCLPKNIIPEIVADISILDTFEKGIFVKDLPIPDTLHVQNDPAELVVKVLPSKKEDTRGGAAGEEGGAETPA